MPDARVTDLTLPPEDVVARVFAEIDARAGAIADLTVELIRHRTVNPPGSGYEACCAFIGRRLAESGFATIRIRADGSPGDSDAFPRANVIARKEGHGPGPCVHFNSHIDVVEAGYGWSIDPFAGVIRDGRVYGRGACDMKGGLAASIIAAEAFTDSVPDYNGAIEIAATADEEARA